MRRKVHTPNLKLARQIRAAGILIDIPEDGPDAPSVPLDGVLIRQTGAVFDSAAFDLAGGAGFMLSLVITINLPCFAISSFDLEVPWGDTVRFLEDPLQVDGTSEVYRFGGRDQLEFHREEVLNHYADVRRILPRGSSVTGLLLAIGHQGIPDDFRHGAYIPAFVTVYDQYSFKHRSPISLWADRSAKRRPTANPKAKRKRLFECPDPRPQNRSSTCESGARSGAALPGRQSWRDRSQEPNRR